MLDQKYSDLTLECDGEEFPVHKAVVLTQSVVLEKACQAHWKVCIRGSLSSVDDTYSVCRKGQIVSFTSKNSTPRLSVVWSSSYTPAIMIKVNRNL